MELKTRVCLPGPFLVKQRNEIELTGNGDGGAFFNFIVRKNEPETGELVSFGFVWFALPFSLSTSFSHVALFNKLQKKIQLYDYDITTEKRSSHFWKKNFFICWYKIITNLFIRDVAYRVITVHWACQYGKRKER